MSLFSKKRKANIVSVGDVFIDTFIELQDAEVTCDINQENCTIAMRFGDKIPYKKSTPVAGVGNAGNAAVSVARLGNDSGLITTTGKDEDGEKIRAVYNKENLIPDFINTDDRLGTNNAYVLQYGPERTILVKQEAYHYSVPKDLLAKHDPSWIYLTSLGKSTEPFHHEFATWAQEHPETKVAFQPGTFQMILGKDVLSDVYKNTTIFFCNKEEAQRILDLPGADFKVLHAGIRALGPKMVVITDGPKGLTASDGEGNGYFVPMYPDPKEPIDRTGAGDACSSTIVAALAQGVSFEQAILWGPINSMSVVQYIGAQEGLLTKEKLLDFLAKAPTEYSVQKMDL